LLSELTTKFSVTLSGAIGFLVITKVAGEGTLTVTALWKRPGDNEKL
jgi:Trypsin-co-occurring domain 1